jgi:hypothetical protein
MHASSRRRRRPSTRAPCSSVRASYRCAPEATPGSRDRVGTARPHGRVSEHRVRGFGSCNTSANCWVCTVLGVWDTNVLRAATCCWLPAETTEEPGPHGCCGTVGPANAASCRRSTPCYSREDSPRRRTGASSDSSVQVCASRVNVLAGLDLLSTWKLPEAHPPPPQGAAVVAATHACTYLLLRLTTGGAVLLAEGAADASLGELAGSGALLRPAAAADVGACCLYEDCSGWLRDHGGDGAYDQVRQYQVAPTSERASRCASYQTTCFQSHRSGL